MTQRKKVAVIGAGVSGLAAAKVFQSKGHEVHGFERGADFGGVWEPSRSYPGVKTQSSKSVYQYTDFPMPDDYPEWPSGEQMHAYLRDYAAHFDVADRFSFGVEVFAMEKRKDGEPGWTLYLKRDAKLENEDFDFVAIASGQFSDKKVIEHPGLDEFVESGGTVLHSSEYTDQSIVEDQDVVVLGGSKSATDIAVNAVQSGAKSVTLVYREKVWRMPYKIAGLINFKYLVFSRLQESQYLHWQPSTVLKWVERLSRPIAWAKFRAFELILKLQLGLKKHDMVPDHRLEDQPSCAFPIVTEGLFPALNDGSIKAEQATFEHYNEGSVSLTNGKTLPCDVALMAIGWNIGVPYLEQKYREKLFEEDGQFRLYRFCVNPDLPDMGFVGFNSSFATILSADMAANWLVRHMDGQLAHKASYEEMQNNINMMLHYKRVERPSAADYGGACAAPFHFFQFDELLRDMGAKKRKRNNPVAEYLMYPQPAAYEKFLETTPQYEAN